ncbi:MAG: phosphatase PAP2 family protein [Kurthia sp.]|nr:phosphatase PAP2 family protein [Candidatus Kurthia equi]
MKMIAALITFIIFIVFASNLNASWVHEFDQWGIDTFKGNGFFEPFHYIGEPLFVVIVAIILLLVLWLKMKNYRGMIFVLITIAGGNVLNLLVKNIVQRDRPNIPDQLTSYSFPSGHSMTGILYLLTLAYILTEFRSKGQKAIAFVFAFALTFCVGLSRVAGMRHYLSDVVSGWSLGFTVFVVAVYWYERRKRQFNQMK